MSSHGFVTVSHATTRNLPDKRHVDCTHGLAGLLGHYVVVRCCPEQHLLDGAYRMRADPSLAFGWCDTHPGVLINTSCPEALAADVRLLYTPDGSPGIFSINPYICNKSDPPCTLVTFELRRASVHEAREALDYTINHGGSFGVLSDGFEIDVRRLRTLVNSGSSQRDDNLDV